jgi:hypothetical protein
LFFRYYTCCYYLVKPFHQPKFCLHLEIPTEIPTDQYQYMVYQYRYRPSCQYQNGIQLYFSRIYFSSCIAHLLYVGLVPLGDLSGNIGEELKIQKLPATVPGVILIYFRSKSCPARQLSTPPATFAFLAVVLIPLHVVPSHLSPPRNSQR